MDQVQNSPTTFRELRRAPWLRELIKDWPEASPASIARALRISKSTVTWWTKGTTPSIGHLRSLAKLSGKSMDELLRTALNEGIDDPCEFGCGNKILPKNPRAKHLYINYPCQKCGRRRIFSRRHHKHFELCRGCENSRRSVQRITLVCVGYNPFGAGTVYSNKCPRHIAYRERRIRQWKNQTDSEATQPCFVDIAAQQFRCMFCAGAFRLCQHLKERLPQEWEEFFPAQNVPRLRTLNDLREAHRKLWKLPQFRILRTKTKVRRTYKRKRKWHEHAAGIARHLHRKNLPQTVVGGVCGLCKKIILSYEHRDLKFHRACLRAYWKAEGVSILFFPKSDKQRGRQAKIETLRTHFAWARLHHIRKESLSNIAARFGVKRAAVQDGIASIIEILPPLDLVKHGSLRTSIQRILNSRPN